MPRQATPRGGRSSPTKPERTASAPPAPVPARSGPPTSTDVARLAGVSRTTVSFVLNGVLGMGISPATRDKVLAAAQQLGYAPHAAARSLAGGSTGTVALVVPRMAHLGIDAFLAQLVASVNEACWQHGLKLLVESSEGEGRQPGGFMQLVRSRHIDGLIVAHPRDAEIEHLLRLRDEGVPLVVFGAGLRDLSPQQLMGDDTARSARAAVNHLLALGHRHVAFVNYARPEFRSVNQREAGWRQALRAQRIAVDPAWITHADISAQSGFDATRELLARGVPFTALFAGNDTIAFGALQALREAGLRVPQDVAVMGYDDIPLAPFAWPPLTTVRTDPAGHGRLAVQKLLGQLRPQADAGPAVVVEAGRVVVRASCGASLQHPSAQARRKKKGAAPA